MRIRTRPIPILTPLLVAAVLAGCGRTPDPTKSGSPLRGDGVSSPPDSSSRVVDGHQRMLRELAAIKSSISSNFFLGDADIRELTRELSRAPENAFQMRGALMFEIGTKNVFLGNIREGIGQQEAAFELLKRIQVPDSVFDRLFFSLGVAHLRLAENLNCVNAHTQDSCLFPIRGGGVHVQPEEAKRSIEYFKRVLQRMPNHLPSRWLINVAYMAIGGYPDQVPEAYLIPPESFESDEDFPRFLDRAGELGLDTFSLAGGSIVDDFDGDGLFDIVVSSWSPAGQIRYFHNQGDGSFTDATEQAGLTGIYGGLNLVQADYDNDSDVDVLVLRGGWLAEGGRHPNSLLQNDGQGRFRDVTFEAGLGKQHYPTQTASWADYDNDGDLDLYVGNEGFPNQLFQNQADGTFVDVARRARVDDPAFTKGVVWGDYDNDRYPDLYVSNMDGPNRLYHNLGNGTFEDQAPVLGVTRPNVSFPGWFWDFNNDGALDLFVASFYQSLDAVAANYLGLPQQTEMDCLYRGDGDGGFEEVAESMNLRRVSQPMGSNFGDLDNDGYLDFYLGTGFPDLEALVPNLMYRNDRGTRFLNVTSAGGFGHLQKGHGVAFADLDNDGDQDVFHELGGWFAGDAFGNALFENPGFGNHWIQIQLVGTQSNRSAIGARIRVDIRDGDRTRSIHRRVNSGGTFGGNPLRQHIGLGKAESIDRLEVFWPTTERTQEFRDVPVDQIIRISEDDTQYSEVSLPKLEFSAVKSESARPHQHHGHKHDH